MELDPIRSDTCLPVEEVEESDPCHPRTRAHFSPHDLRHRRISMLHLSGVPWARIGEHVGQRSLRVTADTYSHVLSDEREIGYDNALRR